MKALLMTMLTAVFPAFAQERFLSAEQALDSGMPLSSVDTMRGHPLYPYLQYRYYRNHLEEVPARGVSAFLQAHANAPFAGWLAERAFPLWLSRGEYQAVIDAYDPKLADESIECEYRLAQLAKGNAMAAYAGLQEVWNSGKSIESACDPLFMQAIAANRLSAANLRTRFVMAMQAGSMGVARHISNLMSADDAYPARLWLSIASGQAPYEQAFAVSNAAWQQNMLAATLARNAFRDTDRVAALALGQLGTSAADPDLVANLYNRLTRALADSDDPRTMQAWSRIAKGKHDDNTVYDVIAYHLRRHDWQGLVVALNEGLDAGQRNAEVNYWLGKGYEHLGRQQESHRAYQLAAKKRDFFGFLAAERLGIAYAFNDRPIVQNPTLTQRLLSQPEAYRMRIFHALGMDKRALAEWKSLLRGKSADEVRQATLLADQLGWHIQAVVALADIKDWDALRVRFPTDYEPTVRALAQQVGLSPATIYAIIRKESIFQPAIRSAAGAVGLMQVMPATARDTARRYGMRYHGSGQLTDPQTNLAIGSHYLADRLNEFGHLAYAAAAYNAGPKRARQWLSENPNLPLDEWVAQIPFTETRDYVKRVLEYEKVYQYRLGLPFTPYASAGVRAW